MIYYGKNVEKLKTKYLVMGGYVELFIPCLCDRMYSAIKIAWNNFNDTQKCTVIWIIEKLSQLYKMHVYNMCLCVRVYSIFRKKYTRINSK